MKNYLSIILLAVIVTFTSCGKTSHKTTDNFEQVVLPDSSVVYLNHNSKISYNKTFNPRTVVLEGEAFFSINDGASEFTVETNDGDEVVVKGTEFFMAVSTSSTVVEVEHGFVVLGLRTGIIKEVRFGERCEFHRHDNGLHLGHAKHKHRHWITLMDNEIRLSGWVLMRSRKHAGHGFHPGNSHGWKNVGKPGKPEKGRSYNKTGKDKPGGKEKQESKPNKGGNTGKSKPGGNPGKESKGAKESGKAGKGGKGNK